MYPGNLERAKELQYPLSFSILELLPLVLCHVPVAQALRNNKIAIKNNLFII